MSRVQLHIPAEALAAIDAAAAAAGETRSDYLRRAALERIGRGPVTPGQLRALADRLEGDDDAWTRRHVLEWLAAWEDGDVSDRRGIIETFASNRAVAQLVGRGLVDVEAPGRLHITEVGRRWLEDDRTTR